MKTSSLTIAIGLLAFAASCSNKSTDVTDNGGSTSLAVDSVVWSDTISQDDSNSFAYIKAVYPTHEMPATKVINAWIAEQLGAKGDLATQPVATMARSIGSAAMDSIRNALKEEEKSGMNPPAPQIITWDIAPLYYTNEFCTYTCTKYIFTGGAHGATAFTSSVISLPDGKVWGYNMFNPDSLADVRKIVVEGLMRQYFKADNEKDFANMLLVKPDNITLPDRAPYITDKGIAFTYQQYEIAPYSEGMPTCEISLDALRPFMTAEALKLFK